MMIVRHNACLLAAVFAVCAMANLGLAVNYYENFESPDVAAYTKVLPSGWVRASQGYGSSDHGLTDKASGDFSTTNPANHQVVCFRYTNSGCTTDVDAIGALELNVVYTISFDVVMDSGKNDGTSYNFSLMAFNDGVVRNDCRSTPSGATVLKSKTGNAPSDGSFETVTFQFFSDPVAYAAWEGKDIAVRLKGATTSGSVDNIIVTSPPKGMVLIFK